MFYCKTRYREDTKRFFILRDTINRGPINQGITVLNLWLRKEYPPKILLYQLFNQKIIILFIFKVHFYILSLIHLKDSPVSVMRLINNYPTIQYVFRGKESDFKLETKYNLFKF